MALDFDSLFDLDLNHDGFVDEMEMKLHELQTGHGFQTLDLNHDMFFDQFQHDLNHNAIHDQMDIDFNKNNIVDQYEQHFNESKIMQDFNQDGAINYSDQIIGKYIFRNG